MTTEGRADSISPGRLARRPTIVDVGLHAGVSTAAVSKVLRNAAGVSPSMRTRVQASIDELGYRPLASARGMRGKTYTIGVLMSDIENPFFALLLNGLLPQLAAEGYEPFIGPGGVTPGSQSAMVEAMIDRQMDGLILIGPIIHKDALDRFGRALPLVVIGRHGPGTTFDTVSGDDRHGSRLIVEHLAGLGHERIAHVTNCRTQDPDPALPESQRSLGYEESMQALGLGRFINLIRGRWSHEGGREAAEGLLAQSNRPSAVHAGSDVAAIGLLSELWDRSVSVPRQLSVVGYDNSPLAALAPIGLTSVDQRGEEMGNLAAGLLLERMNGRATSVDRLLEPTLVLRATSGPLAI